MTNLDRADVVTALTAEQATRQALDDAAEQLKCGWTINEVVAGLEEAAKIIDALTKAEATS